MRRREIATLRYSYAGEFGRGAFMAVAMEFAVLVTVSHFLVTDKTLLWLISSAGFWGLVFALFSAPMTSYRRKKSLVLAAETLSRLLAIAAAFVTTGAAFVVTMGLGIALNAFGAPLVSSIYGANFSSSTRGHAVGRLLSAMIATTAVTATLAGIALDRGTGYYRVVLIVVSSVSLVCSWFANRRIPEARRHWRRRGGMIGAGTRANGPLRNGAERTGRFFGAAGRAVSDCVGVFRRDLAFLYIEIVWFLMGFCSLWLLPVRVLWLKEIGLDEQQIMLATVVVASATMVVAVGLWGLMMYRMNFAAHRMVLCAMYVVGVLIFFHSSGFWGAALGSFVFALALAGGQISWRLIATFFTTPDRVPLYMSVHAFLCGIRGLLGPLASLSLYEVYGAQFVGHLSAAGFALSIVLMAPLIPVLRRRQAEVEGGRAAQAVDQEAELRAAEPPGAE